MGHHCSTSLDFMMIYDPRAGPAEPCLISSIGERAPVTLMVVVQGTHQFGVCLESLLLGSLFL